MMDFLNKALYRKSSMEAMDSPEELSRYISVAKAPTWIALTVILLLLTGFFVWCAFGDVHTSVSVKGVAQDGRVTCYVPSDNPSLKDIAQGQEAAVNDRDASSPGSDGHDSGERVHTASVMSISNNPKSRHEVSSEYDDYTIYRLDLGEWSYEVVLDAPGVQDGVVTARIFTGVSHPLSFFLM